MPKSKKHNTGLVDKWGRRNRTITDKECEHCGKVFRPINSKHRTCSRPCGYAIRKSNPPLKNKGNGWVDSKGYRQIKIDGKSHATPSEIEAYKKENEVVRVYVIRGDLTGKLKATHKNEDDYTLNTKLGYIDIPIKDLKQ